MKHVYSLLLILFPSVAFAQVIEGVVTDENKLPIKGATITVKTTERKKATDDSGRFAIMVKEGQYLQITAVGYIPLEIIANTKEVMDIVLQQQINNLDEVQVIAYGTTTRRLNTGSVTTVSSKEIAKQPVSNVLGALSGMVPGLQVIQSNGIPGSSFSLQIRGRNSISQGSEPLLLIDGIPFTPANENINTIHSAIGSNSIGGGLSPLFNLNPSDIESIDVLKDADATAIYGSRGANGVIFITTKKGRIGTTNISINLNHGISTAPKGMQLMNINQYLEMRAEAFKNNGIIPTIDNAPDILLWNQKRQYNLQKELISGSGKVTNLQLSLSGGNKSTQFLISGNFYQETNIFPGKFPNRRGNVNTNINHNSKDGKFKISFTGNYNNTTLNSTGGDLTSYTVFPPNIPSFLDSTGNLLWTDGFENPYAYLFQKYKSSSGNLTSSLNLNYKLFSFLTIKLLTGYNILNSKDSKVFPKTSRPPSDDQPSTSEFGTLEIKGWNVEPQIEYSQKQGFGKLTILVGSTFQDKLNSESFISLSGFPNDDLLESMQAANTVVSKSNSNSNYRYHAIFGRINYNVQDKYIFNLTGRRDGSSRFGPNKQFANFGAIGGAWIFSQEQFIKRNASFLSYSKLRGSFGITGNDQIGDYQYLDSWISNSSLSYQGISTLSPSNLYNPQYGWEENKKIEAAIELGFFKDRLFFSIDYYRNRSSNQLVLYRLPYTTGFGTITNNFPALIQNKGWELFLNTTPVKNKILNWSNSINITIPQNKLIAFPNIETSSYNSIYVVGQSLNSIYNYKSLGVDPQTGLFHFEDKNKDGNMSFLDYQINGKLDPVFYGGFRNNLNFKGLELDIFFDYKKQVGKNFLYSIYNRQSIPGTLYNQPIQLLNRWQKEGDISLFEKYSTSPQINRANAYTSSAMYSDQSFLRLRNISLSYSFSQKILSIIKAKNANVYIQAQNLYTWNKDKGYSPETQSLYTLPPLKTFTVGILATY
ncbi:hypothetical protein BAY13_17120 [Elizabethkingia bruuniana]|nr:hypothetical protein BAY13_17120 [Elizabethkingia bruuniana]